MVDNLTNGKLYQNRRSRCSLFTVNRLLVYVCLLPFSGSNNQEDSVDMGIVLLICMKPAG